MFHGTLSDITTLFLTKTKKGLSGSLTSGLSRPIYCKMSIVIFCPHTVSCGLLGAIHFCVHFFQTDNVYPLKRPWTEKNMYTLLYEILSYIGIIGISAITNIGVSAYRQKCHIGTPLVISTADLWRKMTDPSHWGPKRPKECLSRLRWFFGGFYLRIKLNTVNTMGRKHMYRQFQYAEKN